MKKLVFVVVLLAAGPATAGDSILFYTGRERAPTIQQEGKGGGKGASLREERKEEFSAKGKSSFTMRSRGQGCTWKRVWGGRECVKGGSR